MKACPRCDTIKPLADFYRDRARRDGHTVYCKACWPRVTRPRGADKKYERKRRNAQMDLIRTAKSRPCTDCGRTYPYYVMDFDHVRGAKAFAIGHANGGGYSTTRVIEEMAKCDVVCSNCHRIRTHQRRYAENH